ncbi:MAG: PD40 domain-containing protein [Gemmatimonadales bacterium]|nr:PD40 domain-containing protein [Gemmatimonadales bacterium]
MRSPKPRMRSCLTAAALLAAACGETSGPSSPEPQLLFVSPVFSSDSFAFSTTDILFASLDGTTVVNLTRHPAADAGPQWSPDGMRIAFVRVDTLYVMNWDGTGPSALVTEVESWASPVWSPSGSDIAMMRRGDIWVVDASGTGLRNVSNSPGWGDTQPAWSPDGGSIAFLCEGDRLCVVQADGTGLDTLTTDVLSPAPAWSPDGREIAYGCPTEMGWGICVIDVAGANRVELTRSADWPGPPRWSPDGTHIAYSSGGDIHVIGQERAGPVNLTDRFDLPAGDPQWSPNGRSLAYAAQDWGVSEIYVQSATDSLGTTRQLVTPIQGWSPRWRPGRSR